MSTGTEDAEMEVPITYLRPLASGPDSQDLTTMPLALRPHFGAHAGGIEHAFALATLVRAAHPQHGTPLLDAQRPTNDIDLYTRLVNLLQDVLSTAEYSIDDLRREGFAEPVLSALRPSQRH